MIARVYKRNDKWYVDYTDHKGNRVRKMQPEAQTKNQAREILHRILNRERAKGEGEVDPLDNSVSVAELIEGFLIYKAATRRWDTVKFYQTSLAATVGRFEPRSAGTWPPKTPTPAPALKCIPHTFVLGPFGVQRAEDITPALIEQYVEENRRTLAIRTLNLRIAALKTLLEWARKGGRIRSNPIADVPRVGRPETSNRVLDVDEVQALLTASPPPYRTIWLTFLTTGVDVG